MWIYRIGGQMGTNTQRSVSFKPRIFYSDIEYMFEYWNFREIGIENDDIYAMTRTLTSLAEPTSEDQYDKRWEYFYLPVKRNGRLVCLPFGIVKYKDNYYVFFQNLGNLTIKKGKNKTDKIFTDIIKETIRFFPVIERTKGRAVIDRIPYDIREGKILGKYIMEKMISGKSKEHLMKSYIGNLDTSTKVNAVSLNEYLSVSAICYRAAFGKKTGKLSPMDMYKRWADGRDGGMLSIKDPDSRDDFSKWYQEHLWVGSHPFEIVFSWIDHGIHLYPPGKDEPNYTIFVTNYGYAWDYLEMVKALIQEKIPFVAKDFKETLDILTGDAYFKVNQWEKLQFWYIPSREYKKRVRV
jgi:hypothetical protein